MEKSREEWTRGLKRERCLKQKYNDAILRDKLKKNVQSKLLQPEILKDIFMPRMLI